MNIYEKYVDSQKKLYYTEINFGISGGVCHRV